MIFINFKNNLLPVAKWFHMAVEINEKFKVKQFSESEKNKELKGKDSKVKFFVKWLQKSDELTQELKTETDTNKRKEIIDENQKHWGKLKPLLKRLSHNKCWYSEAKEIYSYYQVEHFRPKKKALSILGKDEGGYWWLAFDWRNYRLCGGVGNATKGDWFPVKRHKANSHDDPIIDEMIYLLDPIELNDPPMLTFTPEGLAQPLETDETTFDYLRVKETIKLLDLNYDDLVEARKIAWQKCRLKIRQMEGLKSELNKNPSASNSALLKSYMEELRNWVAPCNELSTVYRVCLESSGNILAKRIVSQNMSWDDYCTCSHNLDAKSIEEFYEFTD